MLGLITKQICGQNLRNGTFYTVEEFQGKKSAAAIKIKEEQRQPHPPEGRQQKQEELQSCSLWNKNHIHRKTDKMKRQGTMYQMKEQDKTPEKQLNEVEICNFLEKEFRIMIVKMIQDLGKRMEAKNEKM